MKIHLTNEEKLSFENKKIKQENLQLQIQMLQREIDSEIQKICGKNSKKVEEFMRIDLQSGFAEFKDEKKEKKN